MIKSKIARKGFICDECNQITYLEESESEVEFRKKGYHKVCEKCEELKKGENEGVGE